MELSDQLYNHYNAGQKHPELFRKGYDDGFCIISIRPFYIPGDFNFYTECINGEIHAGRNNGQFNSYISENYFKTVLESSNAQCLLGMINEEPAFYLDIYKAIHYHIPEQLNNIELLPGDMVMQMVIAPRFLPPHSFSSYIIPACLEYAAIGVTRVFFVVDGGNRPYYQLATEARPILEFIMERNRQVFVYLLAFTNNIHPGQHV